MKITIAHGSNDTYGASRVLLQEIDSLLSLGHSVQLLVPNGGPLCGEIAKRGASAQITIVPQLLVLRRSNIKDALRAPRLPDEMASADIVVVWTLGLAGYIPLLRLARKKFYVSVHELLEDRRARVVFRILLRGAFPITACSFAAAAWLRSLGVRDDRIVVTYPVLSASEASSAATGRKVQNGSELFTVAVYGRVNGSKGHREVAQAFQHSGMTDPTWRLVLAGAPFPGQEAALDEVMPIVDSDSRITYAGEVASLRELHPKVDLVAVFPTKPESFGLVPVEAWDCGIRSIGYAEGGAAEVLQLVGGIVIKRTTSDVETIAEALAATRADWDALEKLPKSEGVRSVLSFQNRADKLSAVLTSLSNPKVSSRGCADPLLSTDKGEG
ncbi:glycosyltransferase family 4 protein [Arthrobacter sp. SPG23]|uniref:glycosyltransferase family 4 protein n=1 Tax=Arthrobacter sp. SPG23 TaxID=1610703 RepID=UPI0009E51AA4|nr:glycosyltransferase family 4 protein [Arthrobacter sp. SPG23]